MAYKTGVSSSIAELVAAVKSFAVEQGFTAGPTWVVAAEGSSQQGASVSYVAKNGNYFHFAWNDTVLNLDVGTGTAGAGLPNKQPGASFSRAAEIGNIGTFVAPIKGPHVGYHMFSDGQAIHVAVELTTNVFNHFSFGMINKAGNWEGGAYTEANRWNYIDFGQGTLQPYNAPYHVRMFDGMSGYAGRSVGAFGLSYQIFGLMTLTFDSRTLSVTEPQNPQVPAAVNGNGWSHLGWGNELVEDSPNSFNSRSVLVPVEVVVASDHNSQPANFLQLGQIRTAASINMTNINPKDIVNNDWMVFPLSQKNGPGILYVNSANQGIAYKK